MTLINDGLTQNSARVTAEGELLTLAIVESEREFVSHEQGLTFILSSTYSLTGGEEAISLQNTNDDLDIIIEEIVVSTSASGVVTIIDVDAGLTPGGTGITSKNINLGSSVVAQTTAFGNNSVTGSLIGDVIGQQDIGTSSPYTFVYGGALILAKNKILTVRFATTGVVYVEIHFHFGSKVHF